MDNYWIVMVLPFWVIMMMVLFISTGHSSNENYGPPNITTCYDNVCHKDVCVETDNGWSCQ